MKILYLGALSSTDSDFPLIKALQEKGVDVICYFYVSKYTSKGGLISIDNILQKDEILKASEYESFRMYNTYLNLDNIYIINNYHANRRDIQSWYIWIKVIKHMKKQKADLLHYVWPFSKQRRLLYFFRIKKVFTVHDPFPHSEQYSKASEIDRALAFRKADKLVLLNEVQRDEFCKYYCVNKDKVVISKMGAFDYLNTIKPIGIVPKHKYILFFGQIQPHKGVEYLLKAMLEVHKVHPDVVCIIAGKGSWEFPIEVYKRLDYIEFRNYYITIPELVMLLQHALFAVCPYKDATQSGVVQTAFSMNLPLIVTNVGALPKTVIDGVTGCVVPPCDVKRLADSIIELINNEEKLLLYKSNIKNVWYEKMNWNNIVQIYIDLYANIK